MTDKGNPGNGATYKVRRVDFYPSDWLSAVAGELTVEEHSVYWMICSLIYARGGPIEADLKWLTSKFRNAHWRTIKTAYDSLVEQGKLQLVEHNGKILTTVLRCEKELQGAYQRNAKAVSNGAQGGAALRRNNEIRRATLGASNRANGELPSSFILQDSYLKERENPAREPEPDTKPVQSANADDLEARRRQWRAQIKVWATRGVPYPFPIGPDHPDSGIPLGFLHRVLAELGTDLLSVRAMR